jgi:broad specificity phosphatase PhoE
VIIGAILKVPVAKADALSEFDCGILEGHSDEKSWFEVGRAVRTWLEKGDLDYKIQDGESCHEVQNRFFIFVNRLIQLGGKETYLLVSHGGTLRLTIPFLFQNLPSTLYQDHFFGYTDYAVAEVLEGRLICTEWCGQKMFS